MASVKFYLKDAKSKDETLILMKLYYGFKTPIKYSTGLKVLPSEWNEKKQRLKERRSSELFEDTNDNLDRIEKQTMNLFSLF